MDSTGMLYTLWHPVAVKIVPLANRSALRLKQSLEALSVLLLLLSVSVWRRRTLQTTVALSGIVTTSELRRLSILLPHFSFWCRGEDVPDLKRAGSRID